MNDNHEVERMEAKKLARKARPGGWPKFRNIPRNWIHQGLTYMDAGELGTRLVVEFMEFVIVWWLLQTLMPQVAPVWTVILAGIIAHTWNWVTNGLYWAVIIFTFPSLKNPGVDRTVEYLNAMTVRLKRYDSIAGLAVYGSVSRGGWHDRSDIDIRILRRSGFWSLIQAAALTMRERFIAFLEKQPMDLFLADDTTFLAKMRSDESPLLLISRSESLARMYPGNSERMMNVNDLTRPAVS